MTLTDLKRWHWLAIGLLLGPLLGYCQFLRRQVNGHAGESLRQPVFEQYMRECNGSSGGSRNIVVHPHPQKSGWFIVAGQRDGGEPWWFVAPTPYRDLAQRRSYADVRAFLSSAGADHSAVAYRWAWWEPMRVQLSLWTGGTVLFLGGLWPNLLSFIVLGCWRLPSGGIRVRQSRPAGSTSSVPQQPIDSAETAAVVERMLAEAQGQAADAAPPPPAAAAPPVPVLMPQESPPPADAAPAEDKAYGGREDDFYPTEVGAQRHYARNRRTD